MSAVAPDSLLTTVLYDWHVEHRARMVDFGGWDMPVQYPSGIIAEHLATRRGAGLFDVSHMGRYRLTGKDAERYADRVLTNSAPALQPGQAHYTFIATETGGAVDDAYLYRLGAQDFLLVVNASNRPKDWAWLEGLRDGESMQMEDQSDALAMVSLQGPRSAALLDELFGPGLLPENKRNCLASLSFQDQTIIVARTGYTGESVCFELFVPSTHAVAMWQRLVELGAAPVGLGARDSLRLEAGLPLYGHELGEDKDGNEIPIFANTLAQFAVRQSLERHFVGDAALHHQREEFVQIRRNELATPVDERTLRRLVMPIATFEGRKPMRAGHVVRHDGKEVGYVTSGTTVPYTQFYGTGITATPDDQHALRPIGLALIDSDLRYRSDKPVHLEIEDDRAKRSKAELVERNLWPAAPYARAYGGFSEPTVPDRLTSDDYAAQANSLREQSTRNHRWRREQCINLIPSEQCTSPFVDELASADPSGRYNEHGKLKSLGPDAPPVRYYKGTAYIMQKEMELKAALRTFFDCAQVETRVISGQMANDTVYDALKMFRNRFRGGREPRLLRNVLVHDLTRGGHLSAQTLGALKNYVAIDPKTERPSVHHFPSEAGNAHKIDVEATKTLIAQVHPDLIVFGRSVIIHTEPVAPIAEFVFERFGEHNPLRPLMLYDGAHVLGLLGPHFQSPLAEGADVVTGSPHKTFFGPQRGVVLSDIQPGSAFEPFWANVERRAFPCHVSNHHLGTLQGMLGATYEMLAFKDEYPKKVIDNARAFAGGLAQAGLTLEGSAREGYTQTHQVLLRGARASGEKLSSLLEANGIITNPQAYHDDPSFAASSGVRMGSQEMTRYGMEAADFRELAGLIAEILRDGENRDEGHWRDAVATLRGRFREMRYTL
ncbi:MAG: glycine cleavage system aminomethyltransferase GcvT [Gammaproteobacteria bacterium]